MKLIQETELKIYEKFRNICQKEKMNYYAIGGTCLGAIRHGGFIPWDDDIDIAMPIDDYLAFKREFPKLLEDKYEIIDPNNTNSHSIFAKIQNTDTTFIESVEIDYPQYYKGVWIDIMPICGIPKNILLRKIMLLQLRLYYSFNSNVKFKLKYRDKKGLKSKTLLFICKLLSYKKNDNYWSQKWENILKKHPITEKCDILFPWRNPPHGSYKNIFPYDIFSKHKEVEFENTTIKVPINYDEYLKMDFGDYMKLPPKEKRITHQDENCIIDLDKSFKEYVKIYEGKKKNEK